MEFVYRDIHNGDDVLFNLNLNSRTLIMLYMSAVDIQFCPKIVSYFLLHME